MHRIWFHDSVFLIRPTSTHNNTLQVILKISIFRFADPTVVIWTVATYVQYREAAMSSHKSDFVSAASQTELFGQLA